MPNCYFLIGFLLLATPACAASFDCATAKTPRETLICGASALSDLDAELGRFYRGKKALLTPHGAELLQRSEESWLRYIDIVCPIYHKPKTKPRRKPEQCLTSKYNQRLEQLSKVGEKIGPFVFNRIDLFAAKEVPGDNTGYAEEGYAAQDIAYPQIDGAETEASKAWNKRVERGLAGKDGDYDFDKTDYFVDYTIGIVSAKIISLSWRENFYPHGNPHGTGTVINDNFVLSPQPHDMKPEEVFAPDGWSHKIGELLLAALAAQGWSATEGQEEKIGDEMRDKAASPREWFFTKDGIEFNFSSYEGGCYTCTPRQSPTVRWEDLRPFLAPNAVVP